VASATLRVGRTLIASRPRSQEGSIAGRVSLGTTSTQRKAIGRLARSPVTPRAVLKLTFTDAGSNRKTIRRSVTLPP
jgi:hypothetical protein